MKRKIQFMAMLLIGILLSVNQAWADSKTITFSDVASANSWSNGVAYTNVTIDGFTFNVSGGGNNGKYYTSDVTWRFYSGGGLTITPTTGTTITSVTSNPTQSFTVDKGVASTSFSETVKIKSITINYSTSSGSTYTVVL